MPDDAVKLVKMRNTFYRDNYRRVVFILLLSIFLNIALVIAAYTSWKYKPLPQYFATTVDGRVLKLVPLSQPNLSQESLIQWATAAATAAYTYNFVNYRAAFQKASEYFTAEGYREFMRAVESSNNLDAVIAKKLVVSSVPTGAPVILQQGIINGRYAWKVQLPMLVTYQSASQTIQQSILVTMLISRVPTLNTPKGIGITQFVVQGS